MFIRESLLTVQFAGGTATATIAFTVHLSEEDLNMTGGFWETVYLEPSPSYGPAAATIHVQLPVSRAVQVTPGQPNWELYREHTFSMPRYPDGPFSTVQFHGYIEIMPQGLVSGDDHQCGRPPRPVRAAGGDTVGGANRCPKLSRTNRSVT
jgi:hypothetical protein